MKLKQNNLTDKSKETKNCFFFLFLKFKIIHLYSSLLYDKTIQKREIIIMKK